MQTKNAIKKLEKEGFEVNHVRGERNKTFQVVTATDVLEFSSQEWSGEETISTIGIRSKNDHSDSMTDYCAFTFFRNLTQAINCLKRA